jgi:RNA polymerase sigma factor (sigma-70 family)
VTACADRSDDIRHPDDDVSTLIDDVADAVRSYLAGDARAMTDLVRLVTPWLFAVARTVRLSHHTTEDVVQNTLVTLLQNVHTLRDPRRALSWLAVVARREAIRAIRTERRLELVDDLDALTGATTERDGPEETLLAEATRRQLREALATLPPRNRDLLNLVFLADVRDYARLSVSLGMPIGSIGPTRQRSLDKMRAQLAAAG